MGVCYLRYETDSSKTVLQGGERKELNEYDVSQWSMCEQSSLSTQTQVVKLLGRMGVVDCWDMSYLSIYIFTYILILEKHRSCNLLHA